MSDTTFVPWTTQHPAGQNLPYHLPTTYGLVEIRHPNGSIQFVDPRTVVPSDGLEWRVAGTLPIVTTVNSQPEPVAIPIAQTPQFSLVPGVGLEWHAVATQQPEPATILPIQMPPKTDHTPVVMPAIPASTGLVIPPSQSLVIDPSVSIGVSGRLPDDQLR
jgi:hypothetical protein